MGAELQVEGQNHGDADYDDAWLVALIGSSDAFLDIGCNVGYFSLAACVLRPDAQVLAIDANPSCAATTAANLVRNGFGDRARAVSTFVGAAPGEVTFHTVGLGAAGSALEGMADTAEARGVATTVPTDTLDAILERTGFAPDLVKVDVEGAERDVLAGASATVDKHRPALMIEMHSGPTLSMEQNTSDVLAWCGEHQYAAWYLKTGQRLDDATPVRHRGRCHLLLLPEDAPFPAILEGIPQSAPVQTALDRLAAV